MLAGEWGIGTEKQESIPYTLCPTPSIFTFFRLEAGEGDVFVRELVVALSVAVEEGMLHPVFVVAGGVVFARVGTAALGAVQRTRRDGLGIIDHEADLDGVHQVGVERLAFVANDDVAGALA